MSQLRCHLSDSCMASMAINFWMFFTGQATHIVESLRWINPLRVEIEKEFARVITIIAKKHCVMDLSHPCIREHTSEAFIAELFFDGEKCLNIWEALVRLPEFIYRLPGTIDLRREHFDEVPELVARWRLRHTTMSGA